MKSFFKGKKLKYLIGLKAILLIILLSFVVNHFKNRENSYTTSEVTVGNVYSFIHASGETVAENEVLILCPNNGIVQQVLRLPGNNVLKGEVILTLDKSEIEQQLDAAKDQLEILNNNLEKLNLLARTTRIDSEHNIEVKKLRIASLNAELGDQKDLYEVGGISEARIDKTKQELVLANKELYRSKEKHKVKLAQINADEKGVRLQILMKEKQIAQKKIQIEEMVVKSPGTGVVLEVRAKKGENKKKNELLVRISEHTRLKIKGEISEKHRKQIRNGGKVFVDLGETRYPGVIGNINPELEDDKVQFDVFLEHPHNKGLIINQKVNLLVVTEEKNNVLRVKKGDYFKSPRSQCSVLENAEIYTRSVELGLRGYEYVEIVRGLDSGDVVINSNLMKSSANRKNRIREVE